MAPRQVAVYHGFVSKIAGGCSSYEVIAQSPDLTWAQSWVELFRKSWWGKMAH